MFGLPQIFFLLIFISIAHANNIFCPNYIPVSNYSQHRGFIWGSSSAPSSTHMAIQVGAPPPPPSPPHKLESPTNMAIQVGATRERGEGGGGGVLCVKGISHTPTLASITKKETHTNVTAMLVGV